MVEEYQLKDEEQEEMKEEDQEPHEKLECTPTEGAKLKQRYRPILIFTLTEI